MHSVNWLKFHISHWVRIHVYAVVGVIMHVYVVNGRIMHVQVVNDVRYQMCNMSIFVFT